MSSDPILVVDSLSKRYGTGFDALKDVSIAIERGEILALLGPNGAGKTTLISIICGLVRPTAGRVTVDGLDIKKDYRKARSLVGLVPQELLLEPFERVLPAINYSRGLFGLPRNDAYIEELLTTLSLWDKRNNLVRELSGGMKRRVLIAKALSHEPKLLFLDEPTAGVDVELRKDMWDVVRKLHAQGVTTVLTTHYIEEAEAIADRVGIISEGRILLVEDKASLIQRMGRRHIRLTLHPMPETIPDTLTQYDLIRDEDGTLIYTSDDGANATVGQLIADLASAGFELADIETSQLSLEDIFVSLLKSDEGVAA